MVLDRWGLLVFQTESDLASWNGTYRGSEVVQDAYVWEPGEKDWYVGETQNIYCHVTVLK